jgi:8-oxo-dGTP pyrophosphatase MutT (NUDIX family)
MEDPIIDVCYGVIPYFKRPDGVFEFLIVTQEHAHTGFPKGHPDPGETPEESARRELTEETGINDSILSTQKTYSTQYRFIDFDKKVHDKTVHLYLAEIRDQKARTPEAFTHEITALYWGPYEEVRKKLTYDNVKLLLDEAYKDLLDTGHALA